MFIVDTQHAKFDTLKLFNGETLSPATVQYETYGELSPQKDNAILVIHALTGNAHAAGKNHHNDQKPGWWDEMIGPSKYIDTDKYFVVSTNCLGGCSGTTGPRSINPKTGKRYNLEFPHITMRDQVELQKMLMDQLEIGKWISVIGGSMGGMNALQWAVTYPEKSASIIPIATTSRLSSQSIAFNWVGRKAIMADPDWKNGEYEDELPESGLSIARMLAHITYLSDESMDQKFGRTFQQETKSAVKGKDFGGHFAVESYLNYQGRRFVERFDANCYLYLTRMLDYFDLSQEGGGNLTTALEKTNAAFLVVSFTSDWLFTPQQSRTIVEALKNSSKDVTYCEIESPYGHDAFLLELEQLGPLMTNFLDYNYTKVLRGDGE